MDSYSELLIVIAIIVAVLSDYNVIHHCYRPKNDGITRRILQWFGKNWLFLAILIFVISQALMVDILMKIKDIDVKGKRAITIIKYSYW